MCGVVDDEAAVGLGTRLGADGDTASRCVVVDHALVVIPEYVLWWGRALKQDIKWHIRWEQDNICTASGGRTEYTQVSHVQFGSTLCVSDQNSNTPIPLAVAVHFTPHLARSSSRQQSDGFFFSHQSSQQISPASRVANVGSEL